MKLSTYFLSFGMFFLILNLSYAGTSDYIKIGKNTKINLGESNLNETINSVTKSTQDELSKKIDIEFKKLQDIADKNMTKAVDKFSSKVDEMGDRVNNNIIKKGEDLVNSAQSEFDNLLKIKKRIFRYIYIAEIIFSSLSVGIILLLVFLWTNYRKMKSFVGGSFSFKENLNLKKDIEDLNKKLDEIISKLEKIK